MFEESATLELDGIVVRVELVYDEFGCVALVVDGQHGWHGTHRVELGRSERD